MRPFERSKRKSLCVSELEWVKDWRFVGLTQLLISAKLCVLNGKRVLTKAKSQRMRQGGFMYRSSGIAIVIAMVIVASGCGGGTSGSGSPPPPPPQNISISPSSAL